jgi:hypothetical protein
MTKQELIEVHKKYMARDKSKDKLVPEGIVPCESCGCIGNEDCGHECIDENEACTIREPFFTCACCYATVEGQESNKVDVPDEVVEAKVKNLIRNNGGYSSQTTTQVTERE